MRVVSLVERDDFDRWVGWILATATRDADPPRVVWHRIVTCIIDSNDQFRQPGHRPGKDRGFEMAT
jgi:hypothetical protein